MFKKIMNILFDEEEEILVDEDQNQEEAYEIPAIKPLRERREAMKQDVSPITSKESEPIKALVVTPVKVAAEKSQNDTIIEKTQPSKSIMIDADKPKEKVVNDVPLYFPKKESKTPYQPMDIISPIYGGPEKPSEPIQPVSIASEPIKRRQPITQVLSPMYGRVETPGSLGEIEPEILELNVADMHTHSDKGVEVQASLYDMIEGLEDEE